MKIKEIYSMVSEFVDAEYPKGNKDRGFALAVLIGFLIKNKRKLFTKK